MTDKTHGDFYDENVFLLPSPPDGKKVPWASLPMGEVGDDGRTGTTTRVDVRPFFSPGR